MAYQTPATTSKTRSRQEHRLPIELPTTNHFVTELMAAGISLKLQSEHRTWPIFHSSAEGMVAGHTKPPRLGPSGMSATCNGRKVGELYCLPHDRLLRWNCRIASASLIATWAINSTAAFVSDMLPNLSIDSCQYTLEMQGGVLACCR